jgi:hypothetical protein
VNCVQQNNNVLYLQRSGKFLEIRTNVSRNVKWNKTPFHYWNRERTENARKLYPS